MCAHAGGLCTCGNEIFVSQISSWHFSLLLCLSSCLWVYLNSLYCILVSLICLLVSPTEKARGDARERCEARGIKEKCFGCDVLPSEPSSEATLACRSAFSLQVFHLCSAFDVLEFVLAQIMWCSVQLIIRAHSSHASAIIYFLFSLLMSSHKAKQNVKYYLVHVSFENNQCDKYLFAHAFKKWHFEFIQWYLYNDI